MGACIHTGLNTHVCTYSVSLHSQFHWISHVFLSQFYFNFFYLISCMQNMQLVQVFCTVCHYISDSLNKIHNICVTLKRCYFEIFFRQCLGCDCISSQFLCMNRWSPFCQNEYFIEQIRSSRNGHLFWWIDCERSLWFHLCTQIT